MLVTFTTPSHADITMFGDIATSLLKMMGQSGNVPGAIMADDVGPALESLRSALAASEEQDTGAASPDDENSQKVNLGTRATPLLGLLEAARAAGDNVVWDQ